jgi:hypothetical protein
MPNLVLTNLTDEPVSVRSLYTIIEPGNTETFFRTSDAIMQMTELVNYINDGVLTVQVVYTPAEIAAGFTPIPGTNPVEVQKDGVLIGTFSTLNFTGPDISVIASATPGQVDISIAVSASFKSHWNTGDGNNGSQAVSESISRSTARISTPSGGEGSPFSTNLWAGTNQDATLSGTFTHTTPGVTTGFGGDSTMTVVVYDADGTSVLETYTTPALTGDGANVSPSSNITVTLSSFGVDGSRFSANADVDIDIDAILTAAGREGGRVHVEITHTTDSTTDGTGPYAYVQTDVFYDTNPTTPSIAGTVTIAENGTTTKHISGLEYYTTGSQFTATANTINQINRNTARSSGTVQFVGSEYGLPTLNRDVYGTGDHDQDGINETESFWTINATNYRFAAATANVSATPRDTWGDGSTVASANDAILVDTFTDGASDLVESFDGESRRELVDGVGGAANASSFAGAGTWASTASLIARSGISDGMVFGGTVRAPSAAQFIDGGFGATNADWSGYSPTTGGANPDYSALVAPWQYGRRFVDSAGTNRSSFQIFFEGTFAAGDALADLVAGNLEVYVYRIGGLGNTGAPPGNTTPLRVHEPFNFGVYDDGATVAGSGIREGSSSGNTINCTFGTGTPCNGGVYMHIIVNTASTILSQITVGYIG